MTRTDDLGNAERRSGSGDATPHRTCNGRRKLNRGAPLCRAGVGKGVSDQEKEAAEHCVKKSSGNGGMEKRRKMRSDDKKVRERLPRGRGEPDECLSVTHDRIPAMRDGSSDEDISVTVLLKQNKRQSRGGENNGLPSVDHSSGGDTGHTGRGCTKLLGKNVTSSSDKHNRHSPQNLEEEALQIHPESEASVPDDANLKHQDALENNDNGNHHKLDAQSSDDSTINLQKQFHVEGRSDVAERSAESGDTPKGNCCKDNAGNSIGDSKLKPNLELSNLIGRIQSKLSDARTTEETAKDIDGTESIDEGSESESTDDDSESESSDESSDEESECDLDSPRTNDGDDDEGNVLSFKRSSCCLTLVSNLLLHRICLS